MKTIVVLILFGFFIFLDVYSQEVEKDTFEITVNHNLDTRGLAYHLSAQGFIFTNGEKDGTEKVIEEFISFFTDYYSSDNEEYNINVVLFCFKKGLSSRSILSKMSSHGCNPGGLRELAGLAEKKVIIDEFNMGYLGKVYAIVALGEERSATLYISKTTENVWGDPLKETKGLYNNAVAFNDTVKADSLQNIIQSTRGEKRSPIVQAVPTDRPLGTYLNWQDSCCFVGVPMKVKFENVDRLKEPLDLKVPSEAQVEMKRKGSGDLFVATFNGNFPSRELKSQATKKELTWALPSDLRHVEEADGKPIAVFKANTLYVRINGEIKVLKNQTSIPGDLRILLKKK